MLDRKDPDPPAGSLLAAGTPGWFGARTIGSVICRGVATTTGTPTVWLEFTPVDPLHGQDDAESQCSC